MIQLPNMAKSRPIRVDNELSDNDINPWRVQMKKTRRRYDIRFLGDAFGCSRSLATSYDGIQVPN